MNRFSPPRLISLTLVSLTFLVLTACSSDNGQEKSVATSEFGAALPDDAQILTKVYAPAVSVPADFYVDPTAAITTPHTLHHVKSTDLDPTQAVPYELCSDDFDTAVAWSEAASVNRVNSGPLVTTSQTTEYFEFVRLLDALPEWSAYERIFKCTYVDRSGADLRAGSGPAGRLNRQPLSPEDLTTLVEYLWQFSAYNNAGNAVLTSTAFDDVDGPGHTLTLASLRSGAGAVNGCDQVTVWDWTFVVDRDTGTLTSERQTLTQFDSRNDNGAPERCTS